MRRQRRAQIALEDLDNILRVLYGQRAIESELVQQAFATRGIHAALPGKILHRITRDEVDQCERKQRDPDKGRDDERSATQDEREHDVNSLHRHSTR